MNLIFGQAGVVQREATKKAMRRFAATAGALLALGLLIALYVRMQSGGFDEFVTRHDAELESSILTALDGTMWPEQEFRARVAAVEGWDTLVVLGPRTRHGHLAALVGGEGLLARDRINRLEGHLSATAPIRIVAIQGGRWIVADVDVEWGDGFRNATRLKQQGFLVVQRDVGEDWSPGEL